MVSSGKLPWFAGCEEKQCVCEKQAAEDLSGGAKNQSEQNQSSHFLGELEADLNVGMLSGSRSG